MYEYLQCGMTNLTASSQSPASRATNVLSTKDIASKGGDTQQASGKALVIGDDNSTTCHLEEEVCGCSRHRLRRLKKYVEPYSNTIDIANVLDSAQFKRVIPA